MDHSERALLLKQFSSILRNRSKDEKYQKLTLSLVYQYSRKDLIEIIQSKFEGKVPEDINLMELENLELLTIIGDDMYLIAYSIQQWNREIKERNHVEVPNPPPAIEVEEKESQSNTKAKTTTKTTTEKAKKTNHANRKNDK